MSTNAGTQKAASTGSGPALFPDWFRTYIDLYEAEVAHGFLLCGDLWGVTTRNLSQRQFLQQALATRRDIIAVYDTARGITFPKPEMREQALRLLTQEAEIAPADPVRAALASAGTLVQPAGDVFSMAREPLEALSVLDRLLRATGGRNRVAVLVDFLDTLCPATSAKALMSEQDRRLLVFLLAWGQDQDLARCDNPVFLLAREASEVHADLRATGSGYARIEIPRPDLAERRSYLSWYLEAREAQGRPVRLTGLSVELLANLTAGLNLRDIENVVLQADRGYCKAPQLLWISQMGAAFLVRYAPWHLPLYAPGAQAPTGPGRLDVRGWLSRLPVGTSERPAVLFAHGSKLPLRLIALVLPKEEAAARRRQAQQRAREKGIRLSEASLFYAGFVLLVTTLPQTNWSAARLLELYRCRWQIEILFKRIKQVLDAHRLPCRCPQTTQALIAALLVGWLLIEEEAQQLRARIQAAEAAPVALSDWQLDQWAGLGLANIIRGWWEPAHLRALAPELGRLFVQKRRRPLLEHERKRRFAAWLGADPVLVSVFACSRA